MASIGSTNISYVINIIYGLIVIGAFILLFFKTIGSGSLVGYSIITGGLFILLLLQTVLTIKNDTQNKFLEFIKSVFSNQYPLLFLLALFIWITVLNIKHYKNITKNNVTNEYNNFSNIGIFLFFIQLFLLFKVFKQEEDELSPEPKSAVGKVMNVLFKNIKLLMLFLAVIQAVVIGIMQINLDFFTTDG
jgi:hypothetical protein